MPFLFDRALFRFNLLFLRSDRTMIVGQIICHAVLPLVSVHIKLNQKNNAGHCQSVRKPQAEQWAQARGGRELGSYMVVKIQFSRLPISETGCDN
jgi:hypothetical protein